MRMIRRLGALGALAILTGCAGGGSGDAFRRGVSFLDGRGVHVVPANQSVSLEESYLTLSRNCEPRPMPRITFLKPPRHGRATSQVGGLSYPQFTAASHKHCNKTLTRATVINYRPDPGYRGPDALVARIRYRDGETRVDSFKIEVR